MRRTLTIFLRRVICLASMAICLTNAQAQNTVMESDMFGDMRKGDKAAVVAVYFGTSNDVARVMSIERLNNRLKEAFPDYDFREAWTSSVIIYKLRERQIVKYTPQEVLDQLKLDGFTHVLVQPSYIIEGTENDYLNYVVNNYKTQFKSIRVSQPLLRNPEDYEAVIDAEKEIVKDKKSMNVLVCHGSKGAKNSQYTMLDYIVKDKGYSNWTVATIEGFPTMDNLVRTLRKSGFKKVNLIPFLFTAGEHVKNDLSGKWKKKLEDEGFKVKVLAHGLGENDKINDVYVKHAKYTQTHKVYSSLELKTMVNK